MSTRSGKRIHGSMEENSSKNVVSKVEIKPSNRNADDIDVIVSDKKRKHYVGYPSEEDIENKTELKHDKKPSRKSRRQTLKERNVDSEIQTKDKLPIRQTRRTKLAENVEDNTEPKTSKKKNKKKKKGSLSNNSEEKLENDKPKKKSNKKKSKSKVFSTGNSQEERENVNKSNMSVDSFHSAAGTPVKEDCARKTDKPDDCTLNVSLKTKHDNTDKEKQKKTRNIKKRKSSVELLPDNVPSSDKNEDNTSDDCFYNNISDNTINTINEQKLNGSKRKSSLQNVNGNGRMNTAVDEKDNRTNLNDTYDKNDKVSTEMELLDSNEKKLCSPTIKQISKTNKMDSGNTSVQKSNIRTEYSSPIPNNTYEKNAPYTANGTYENNDQATDKLDVDSCIKKVSKSSGRKSSLRNCHVNDKSQLSIDNLDRKTNMIVNTLNDTYEKNDEIVKNTLNTTFDKKKSVDNAKDSTYDKLSSNGSLISSDSNNLTFDKSNERISITSDDSTVDNKFNSTPVVIESSLDESKLNTFESGTALLKREGTFTKDEHLDQSALKVAINRTPTRRKSLPSPGCTPFPFKKSTSNEKNILNVTRSIEKARRSSLAECAPKMAKVMFCSPVNNPGLTTQIKKKIIKSSMKGSNKSFVFDDSEIRKSSRKRSLTHCDAEVARAKRKRLADDMQESVDRLSRPRTASASAKLQEPGTPSKKTNTPKKGTPSKEAKQFRTKLPNFAALHQKQFEKMESLDECQERKAKRARHLLTPIGAVNMLERISPKETTQVPESTKKTETPTKSKPESANPVYTRFGFKLNLDNNPFKFSAKNTDVKSKKNKPSTLKRQLTVPSLNGTTLSRRDFAKQSVMREKSFTDRNIKRTESRTIIKGVRTNRRFELQMKMRNIT